jgi:NADPH-dependent F420 reductase
MRVTIIGPGNMGRGIATRLLAGGHTVTLVGAERGQAEEAAAALRTAAAGASVEVAGGPAEAVPESEVVVLALPYQASLEEAGRSGALLDGKVVVDISNPLNETYTGLVTEGGPSGAERIRERLPAGARLVKAFNTVFAATLAAGDVAGQQLDVFIAGDDDGANERVAEMVRSGGMRPVVVGGLERARQLEALGFLGISLQEPLGTGFRSGWKLVMPAEGEEGRKSFPRDAVVGAVEPGAVGQVLAELEAEGLGTGRVQTVSGPDGEERILGSGRVGVWALEFLFGFEAEHTRRHVRQLEDGLTLVAVWVEDGAQADRVGDLLTRHGGQFVNYYSRWTARSLAP